MYFFMREVPVVRVCRTTIFQVAFFFFIVFVVGPRGFFECMMFSPGAFSKLVFILYSMYSPWLRAGGIFPRLGFTIIIRMQPPAKELGAFSQTEKKTRLLGTLLSGHVGVL